MKLNCFVTAGLVSVAVLAAPAAHAAFVVGSASATGFFQNNTTALGVPTALVSTLATFDVNSTMLVGSVSGDMSVAGGFGTALDFSFLSVPQQMYMFAGFTFDILDWGPVNVTALTCADRQCSDGIGFSGTGSVTGNGFQATAFTMGWSAQGSCNESTTTPGQCGSNATASWSASISGTGEDIVTQVVNEVPEPATLALVGLALAGAGVARRRRG